MSPPAQKCPPSPLRTTQRTSLASARHGLEHLAQLRHIARDMALSLPGCDRVTTGDGAIQPDP
jgi:hypothetical protein